MITLEDEQKMNFEDCKPAYWHTSSHILAEAVLRLFPRAKLAIGPAIDSGFYYDIDCDTRFTEEHLAQIESEIQKIIAENHPLIKTTKTRNEALEFTKDNLYKQELINNLPPDAVISFYSQGKFTDMCAGPHLASTGQVGAVKLTSCTGAYWRGDSKNKMLQRIYGVSFETPKLLREHLARLAEAKKRDHNKIGRELEFFTTSDIIGQGLPILLPKGARVIQLLQRFVEDEEERRGYLLTKTPLMAKSDLYKISGHWDHYRDGMFIIGDPESRDIVPYALRPMTCPFQYQTFLNRKRSYRDLPMRLSETSTLFRNEDSGEMHGLIRIRQFTISEGHLIVRPDQLQEEFLGCVKLAQFMLTTLGLLEDCTYRFSKWDENNSSKYEGTKEQWNEAQDVMQKILDDIDLKYSVGIDEAAFYGPKLDIQIKNVYGKEDTLITIQIDMLLAKKFKMEYIGEDGSAQTPYIIHRTSIGCYERTLALLLEKYAGALPLWLSPEQVCIIPIAEVHHKYAKDIEAELTAAGLRVRGDYRAEKMNYKIREAQLCKTPYMLVVGDKEETDKTVAVRARKEENSGIRTVKSFIELALQEVADKVI